MPRIMIDGRAVDAREGASVLEAARAAGLHIPSLCAVPGFEQGSSCMACLVKDLATGRFIPSCAAEAAEGMRIDATSPEVVRARRHSISLLLSEHAGDCDGPCTRACPAGVDVPRMLAAVAAGKDAVAFSIVADAVAFPAISSLLCRAPCEKACRRALHDSAVSIRAIEGFAAAAGGRDAAAIVRPAASGKSAVVAGTGLVGLSCAFHLARFGVSCIVVGRDEPFTLLRRERGEPGVGENVLESATADLRAMGVVIEVRGEFTLDAAVRDAAGADAFVVAVGGGAQTAKKQPIPAYGPGSPRIVEAENPGESSATALRALAAGRRAASNVLSAVGMPVPEAPLFNSRSGRVDGPEIAELMRGAHPGPRTGMENFGPEDAGSARLEALRCMGCDCLKKDSCRLRAAASEAGIAKADRDDVGRRGIMRDATHPEVVYEPGKCILCGACVQVSARAGERWGLGFEGRGYETRVAPPFGKTFAEGLERCALECADACPTGAISRKRRPNP